MVQQYRVFDWYLKNKENYKKTKYLDVVCGSFNVTEETNYNTDSYFYNVINSYPSNIGNTFSAIFALDNTNTSPVTMSIKDGIYEFSIEVSTYGVLIDGTNISLDTSIFNNYWMTLKDGEARLYINDKMVWYGEATGESDEQENIIGFQNYVDGTATVYIKYLRCTHGAKYPIDLDNLKFEVQVDTTDEFNSINLRTYYNEGTKVLCREDDKVESVASGNKLARSFRIPLIPRQPDMPYFYFFRVRVLGDNGESSDWAYYMYDQPDNPFLFETVNMLSDIRDVKDGLVVFCVENRKSYKFIKGSNLTGDGDLVVPCPISGGVWKQVSNSYFMLDPDISDVVFEHMYDDRLPGENVYTRYNKSGNVATILSVESKLIDVLHFDLLKTIRNTNIQSASDGVLESNFGNKYNLSKELFDNMLEYRYALLAIEKAYCTPGEYKGIVDIFRSITGVYPQIYEYKNYPGWVIWSDNEALHIPDSDKFYLSDDDSLYPTFNEIVLYSDEGLAFGFDIEIYNPFGMKLPENLVKNIVYNYKPAPTEANIIMHTQIGREYQYPAYYYFSHYGKGLYYPEDFES